MKGRSIQSTDTVEGRLRDTRVNSSNWVVFLQVNRVESRSTAEQSSDPQQRLLLRRNTQTYRYANLKLVFVPLVFILTRIWGTIRFILDLIPNSTVKRIAAWLAPFQVSDFQLRWCVRTVSMRLKTCLLRFVKRLVTVGCLCQIDQK